MVIPSLPTSEAVFLAAGVLGATIMPHVIYLHSSLTQNLHGGTSKERYSASKWDVAIAMTIAGFVNLAMMATAAAAFHFNGHTGVADLDQAYLTLEPLLSHAAATIFGLSLVAAGLSSTVVGTLAGQVVMQGFVRFHIPLWVRRSVTMLPSFVVILMGLDPTRILVMSQVLLSFDCAGAGAAADLHQQQITDGRSGEFDVGETRRVGHCGRGGGVKLVVADRHSRRPVKKKEPEGSFLLLMVMVVTVAFAFSVTPAATAVVTIFPAFAVAAFVSLTLIPATVIAVIVFPPAVLTPFIMAMPVVTVAPVATVPVSAVVITIANL